MKQCCSCKIEKDEAKFARRKSAKDGLQSRCNDCVNLAMKADYHAQKAKKLSQYENLRNLRLDYIDDIRMQGCIICNENSPECIDFHHVNPKDKVGNVSQMAMNKVSLEKIKAEIDKCIVLCSNCHRKVHAGTITIEIL